MSFFSIFKKKKTKNIARDRLKMLLISDRVDCNPEIMEKIKEDIVKVISKYIEIDNSAIEVHVRMNADNDVCQANLCANVPIKSVSNNLTVKTN